MSQARQLVLATGNANKVREMRGILADLPLSVTDLGDFEGFAEPVEDGLTFAANARLKSLYYARATGHWCLADDSGLVVDALGGAPGVRSARYARDDCPPRADRAELDRANNARLLRELADVPPHERTARFVCHVVLAKDDGILLEAHGQFEGLIAAEPRGCNGFGYDPIFFVPELARTAAELTPAQKNAVSHRGKALRQLVEMLKHLPEIHAHFN